MDSLSDTASLPLLGLNDASNLETVPIFKAVADAEATLGELRGVVQSIPNEDILLNTLSLQEARASAEIENIVSTTDELYRSYVDSSVNGHAREVVAHAQALREGFAIVRRTKQLRLQDLLAVQARLIGNDAGLRKQSGTVLKNSAGETYIYATAGTVRDRAPHGKFD